MSRAYQNEDVDHDRLKAVNDHAEIGPNGPRDPISLSSSYRADTTNHPKLPPFTSSIMNTVNSTDKEHPNQRSQSSHSQDRSHKSNAASISPAVQRGKDAQKRTLESVEQDVPFSASPKNVFHRCFDSSHEDRSTSIEGRRGSGDIVQPGDTTEQDDLIEDVNQEWDLKYVGTHWEK